MPKNKKSITNTNLFDRVVSILEEARHNVVRAVNSNMVLAYWLIGREIVEEIQGGEERAEYGKKVIEELSERLTKKYKRGFSTTNLWYFKQFYVAFSDKSEILHTQSGESEKHEPIIHTQSGELTIPLFSQRLSWSHYRVLMRISKKEARDFYEKEAIEKYSVLNDRKQFFESLNIPVNEFAENLFKPENVIEKSYKPEHPSYKIRQNSGNLFLF